MKKYFIITGLFFLMAAPLALGQRTAVSNTARQGNQQKRIVEGVRSGELTAKETVALEREQKRIQLEKRIAKADGTVTPREKRWLRREQNRASRHIARQKNDAQDRK